MNEGSARSTEREARLQGACTPRVSILMPVWNSERHLRESIDSVLAQQTEATFELIVIDDGSADTSVRIALDYVERNEGTVRLLRHPGGENRGTSASRNLGLKHARGAYLTFLDADDVWLPHCLHSQLQAFERHPEAAMVYCAAERWCDLARPFDEAEARAAWWGGNYIPPVVPAGEQTGLLHLGELLEWYLQDESMVPCICSVMVRTDVARAVGGFDEQFRGLYDDQAFHAKVVLAYPVLAHDACVARYRQHGGSCCAEAREDDAKQQAGRKRFLDWLLRYRRTLSRAVPKQEVQPLSEEPV